MSLFSGVNQAFLAFIQSTHDKQSESRNLVCILCMFLEIPIRRPFRISDSQGCYMKIRMKGQVLIFRKTDKGRLNEVLRTRLAMCFLHKGFCTLYKYYLVRRRHSLESRYCTQRIKLSLCPLCNLLFCKSIAGWSMASPLQSHSQPDTGYSHECKSRAWYFLRSLDSDLICTFDSRQTGPESIVNLRSKDLYPFYLPCKKGNFIVLGLRLQ